jgi:hypothetical protein
MNDGQLRREFGQHLIEEVLAGRMTRRELLTRASIFGLSATAIGSLLPACGSSMSANAVSAYTNPDSCLLATSGWVRQGIILRGTPGAWDYTIGEVSIIHDSGIWKMWYMGAEPGVLAAIGYATAPSLAGPWTKNTEGTPVPLTVLTPGFQTDGNSDGVADNWTVYKNVGGTPTFSLATGHTGSFA